MTFNPPSFVTKFVLKSNFIYIERNKSQTSPTSPNRVTYYVNDPLYVCVIKMKTYCSKVLIFTITVKFDNLRLKKYKIILCVKSIKHFLCMLMNF